MGAYLAGIALSVPALLVWHIPRRWWVWLERSYGGGRMLALLRSTPAATLGAWLLFAVFFPLDTALGGDRRDQGISLPEILAIVVCAAPWLTTMVGGWPMWLLPPGSRNKDEADYFTGHWAGIFAFMAGGLAVNFAIRSWWPAVALMAVGCAVLALIQVAFFRRRPGSVK